MHPRLLGLGLLVAVLHACGGAGGPGTGEDPGPGPDPVDAGQDAGDVTPPDAGDPPPDGGDPAPPDGGDPLPPGNALPSFSLASSATLTEDTPSAQLPLTAITAGSVEEDAAQTVSFETSLDTASTGIVSAATVTGVGPSRTLTLTLVPDAAGTATVQVTADDGAGGSATRTLVLTVTPVNDAPTLVNPGPQALTGVSAVQVPLGGIGPGGGADEQAQPVTLSVLAEDPALFADLSVSAVSASGEAQLTLTPQSGAHEQTQVTVTADDGQAQDHTRSVTFTVGVNEAQPSIAGLTPLTGPQSGCVALTFDLLDANAEPASVALEVDDGSGYRAASLQASPAQPLATSPGGVSHTLVWRSTQDVVGALASGVKLRLTPRHGPFAGAPAELGGLTVDNRLSLAAAQHFAAGPGAFQAVVGDVDGDGRLDVVAPDSFSNTVSVMYGLPAGGFEPPVELVSTPALCNGFPPKPFSVNLHDGNQDGFLDILVVHENCDTVGVLLSSGARSFQPYGTVAVGRNPLFGVLADVTEDGVLDYAVVNFGSNDVSLLVGTAGGGFQPQVRVPTGSEPNKIDAADFDGDGHVDLVTADSSDNRIAVLYGDGAGDFLPHTDFDAGTGPRNLGVGDFNGDGRPDVVTANPGPANDATTAALLLRTGTGFSAPTFHTVQTHPRSVAVGDLNGDGKQDVGIGNVGSNSVSVLLGHGDGTFIPAQHFAVGAGPHSVQFADLDGDGRPEIVTGNSDSQNVSVLANQTPVCAP